MALDVEPVAATHCHWRHQKTSAPRSSPHGKKSFSSSSVDPSLPLPLPEAMEKAAMAPATAPRCLTSRAAATAVVTPRHHCVRIARRHFSSLPSRAPAAPSPAVPSTAPPLPPPPLDAPQSTSHCAVSGSARSASDRRDRLFPPIQHPSLEGRALLDPRQEQAAHPLGTNVYERKAAISLNESVGKAAGRIADVHHSQKAKFSLYSKMK